MFVAVMKPPKPGKVPEPHQPQAGSCTAGGCRVGEAGLLLPAGERTSAVLFRFICVRSDALPPRSYKLITCIPIIIY